MKILHVSYSTDLNNLAFPHYQFHKNIKTNGYDSKILSIRGDLQEEGVYYLNLNRSLISIFLSKLFRRLLLLILNSKEGYSYFPDWNVEFTSLRAINKLVGNSYDIIFVYGTKYGFDFKLLYSIQRKSKAKIYFVNYDLSHMTGGCNYSLGCNKYFSNCCECPAIKNSRLYDLAHNTYTKKKEYILKMNAKVLYSSSRELAILNESDIWKNQEKLKFPIGAVDENLFYPKSPPYILNENSKLNILFSASHIDQKRKGFKIFVDAINKLVESDSLIKNKIKVTIIGRNHSGLEINLNCEFDYLGYIDSIEELAEIYRKCDFFVNSPLEDAGPVTLKIACMSGLPIVTFDEGLASELVVSNHNGFIIKNKNSDELSTAILEMVQLDKFILSQMSFNSRNLALVNLSLKSQFDKFIYTFM